MGKLIGFMTVLLLTFNFGCVDGKTADNKAKGLSATASARNAAILITASSYTPGYAGYFQFDVQNMNSILSSSTGNWGFTTYLAQEATAPTMSNAIAQVASQVSEDGTLLVFLAAHGAWNGMIESNGSAYANYGYSDVLNAIRAGRGNAPFRRLVLFVSSCYSGSWFSTLQSSNGLFSERLVISSTTADQMSNIGQATGIMAATFRTFANSPGLSVRQFLDILRAGDPGVLYQAIPDQILDETFVNPNVTPQQQNQDQSTPAPADKVAGNDGNTSAPSETANPNGDKGSGQLKVGLLTQTTGGVTQLYAYSSVAADNILIYSPLDNQWYTAYNVYAPQTGWPTVRGIPAEESWTRVKTAKVRVVIKGQNYDLNNVAISH